MATDHRLEVVLAARDATQKAFKTATARIDGYRKKIVNMRTVMVGAAGAAGIGYFVKKQLESADATAKAADAIGVSTKALQEYRFIADRSGVATGTLEQGLGAFTKRLGELKSGTGALNTLLNKNNQALAEQQQPGPCRAAKAGRVNGCGAAHLFGRFGADRGPVGESSAFRCRVLAHRGDKDD